MGGQGIGQSGGACGSVVQLTPAASLVVGRGRCPKRSNVTFAGMIVITFNLVTRCVRVGARETVSHVARIGLSLDAVS